MRFTVHIGAEKTGSTSIQDFLATNRAELAADGFTFPKSLGASNQLDLALVSIDPERIVDLHRVRSLTTPDAIRAYIQDRTERFTAELERSRPDHVVLSNEHLSSKLTTDEVARFATWIGRFSRDCRIVVYLRRQDLMHLSWYSTRVKIGYPDRFSWPPPGDKPLRYDFLRMVRAWADQFGKQALTIRVFEPARLRDGDVVRDFCAVLGVTDDGRFSHAPAANTSLDTTQLAMLRRLNERVTKFADGRPNPDRGPIQQAIEGLPSRGVPLRASRAAARAFMADYETDNATLASEFLPDLDGPLFSDRYGDVDTTAEPDLDVDTVLDMAAATWTFQQHRVGQVQQRSRDLRARLVKLRTRLAAEQPD